MTWMFWRVWGFCFRRWHLSICGRLEWYHWFHVVRWWTCNPKWYRKLFRSAVWPDWPGSRCPNCLYDFEHSEDPWFKCLGQSSNGDCGYDWWGIQTCPRCRHKYEWSDGS